MLQFILVGNGTLRSKETLKALTSCFQEDFSSFRLRLDGWKVWRNAWLHHASLSASILWESVWFCAVWLLMHSCSNTQYQTFFVQNNWGVDSKMKYSVQPGWSWRVVATGDVRHPLFFLLIFQTSTPKWLLVIFPRIIQLGFYVTVI